jgi:hypothetical protein
MYAEGTSTPPERTQMEIQKLVRMKGAQRVGFFSDNDHIILTFQTKERVVKFKVTLPTVDAPGARLQKQARASRALYSVALPRVVEAEVRRRWRALLLSLKAKFELVESEIETFDEAFLAQIVTPGGATVFEAIRLMSDNGQKLLAAPGESSDG